MQLETRSGRPLYLGAIPVCLAIKKNLIWSKVKSGSVSGISTAIWYNALCFDGMVHCFTVLNSRYWDNKDWTDKPVTIIPNCRDSHAFLHSRADTGMQRLEYAINPCFFRVMHTEVWCCFCYNNCSRRFLTELHNGIVICNRCAFSVLNFNKNILHIGIINHGVDFFVLFPSTEISHRCGKLIIKCCNMLICSGLYYFFNDWILL